MSSVRDTQPEGLQGKTTQQDVDLSLESGGNLDSFLLPLRQGVREPKNSQCETRFAEERKNLFQRQSFFLMSRMISVKRRRLIRDEH